MGLIGLAAAVMFGDDANLIEKKIYQNGTYNPADEEVEEGEDPVDGYSPVVVNVPLIGKLITANGVYNATAEPAVTIDGEARTVRGYSQVTVRVPQDDELLQKIQQLEQCCAQVAAILEVTVAEGEDCCTKVKQKAQQVMDENSDYQECCEQVAAALGVDTTQEYDCEDVLDAAEAAEAEIDECNQCKAAVISKLQEYDPDFDPVSCSDIPDKVDEIIEEKSGYEFPQGTEYPDIVALAPADTVTDETLGITLVYKTWRSDNNYPQIEVGYIQNGEYRQIDGIYSGMEGPDFIKESFTVTDPTTGAYEFTCVWPDGISRTRTGSTSALIGFGSSGHTYKVKNS